MKQLKRMTTEQYNATTKRDKFLREHADVIVTSIYTMLFANQIACNLVEDLDGYFIADGIFKQRTKMDLKLIKSTAIQFKDGMFEVYGDKEDYFVTTFQKIIHDIKLNLDILFYSIQGEILKHKEVKCSVSISRLEQARAVLCLSCQIRAKYMDDLRKLSPSIPSLEYLSMDKLLLMIDKLSNNVNKAVKGRIDLNENLNCKNAMIAIAKRITNREYITKNIKGK